MTKLERAQKVAANESCEGFWCGRGDTQCPAYLTRCGSPHHLSKEAIKACSDYIKSQEGNMDKDKAMARLDAIEKEAQELRKIIDGKLEYDDTKLYVGLKDGQPYILAGSSNDDYFRFHVFADSHPSEQGWEDSSKTGQKCLDRHIADGFDIHVFDDTEEALQFFMDNL